jgi:multidrug resistance efflux pump
MDAADSNGKVTLAVLGGKIDEILRRLDRMEACQERQAAAHEARLNSLEQGQATRIQQLHALEHDVEALEVKSERWSIINSGLGVIAAALAALGFGGK